jgi:hypothetical protein
LCITGIHDESGGFGYVKSLMYKIKIDGLGMVSFIDTIILDAV